MSKYTILVVDDNKSILTAVRMLLEHTFERVITTPTPHSILHTLESEAVDVVLLDMNFSAGLNTGNEGLFHLREIKKHFPKIPVVLFTAYADIELAVNGIKEGAADFVVKPWDNDKLVATLRNVCESGREEMQENKAALSRMTGLFWGGSPAMRDIRSLVEKIARTEASVLISGENGTGKSLLASEIHRLSLCASKPLVTVDLGAISESLFESELFGHVKGAFTDAKSDRVGKLEEAHGTTLFLDEIGNLAFPLQAKLLTAIQQKTITRVGSNKTIPVDFRLVCATNQRLQEKVQRGEFREDLFYRINTIHFEIPPLRKRPEDIVPLAENFIRHFAEKYHRQASSLTSEAADKLRNYPWYGNIRELEHAVEKAVIISDGMQLDAADFQLMPSKPKTDEVGATTLEEMEIALIRRTIDQCSGNLSVVASTLGITRQTLYNKMKKYGL